MKAINSMEILGIGSVRLYNIKTDEKEFEMCNKDLVPLTKVAVEKGKLGTYKYIDNTGKEYSKADVFYNINGRALNKVSRTEKVNKFNIVDKTNIIGN